MNASPAPDAQTPLPTFDADALQLSPDLKKALAELGYVHPTPVQLAVFEPASRGRNLVVQARTGTGKTAAFGLPIIDALVRKSLGEVQALVLTPTRELAIQVCTEISKLAKFKGIKALPIYGGAPMGTQIDGLKDGAQIVVGTPGRVLDHLRRGTLNPKSVRIFVLDEADEMLSMGFAKELNAIIETLPSDRQGLYFSATIPPDIERLAQAHLRDPEWIALSSDQVGALSIKHFTYVVSKADKRETLMRVLEADNPESAIVFCNTKDETERLAEALQNRGYDAASLNGDMDQREREKVMARTREGKLRFLVATDVAARGIDVSHLTHVINFDFPESTEAYVHRTGRTGRAGRTGVAISLVGPKDFGNLYLLRLTYKIRPIERSLPTSGELRTREETDLVNVFLEGFSDEPSAEDLSLARRLLTHDRAEAVIAGLLRGFLGVKAGDPRVAAGEARRAKNPPPVVVPPPAHVPTRAPMQAPTPAVEPRASTLEKAPRENARDERSRDGRGSGSEARPREAAVATAKSPDLQRSSSRRRGVPHAEFASWEPPAEKDDDQPILTDRGVAVAAISASSPTVASGAPATDRLSERVPSDRAGGGSGGAGFPEKRAREGERDPRGQDARRSRGHAPSRFSSDGPDTQPFRTPEPVMPGITVGEAPQTTPGFEPTPERAARFDRAPTPRFDRGPATPEREREPVKEVEDDPSFAQLFLNVGRRDGLRPDDVHKLLVELAHIDEPEHGRIRMRERITFVSVRPDLLEQAISALGGHVVAGRSLVAERAKPRTDER